MIKKIIYIISITTVVNLPIQGPSGLWQSNYVYETKADIATKERLSLLLLLDDYLGEAYNVTIQDSIIIKD